MVAAFDKAWELLKTEFLLDSEESPFKDEIEHYPMPISAMSRGFYNADVTGNSVGRVNLAHRGWPGKAGDYSPEYGRSGVNYDPKIDDFRNTSWDAYDKKYDQPLMENVIDTAAHESTHEAIQNTPEMISAFKNAYASYKQGDVKPMVQLQLAHELMASRHDPAEALRHPLDMMGNAHEWGKAVGDERVKVKNPAADSYRQSQREEEERVKSGGVRW